MNMQILPLFEHIIDFFFMHRRKEMLLVGGFHLLKGIGSGFPDLSFEQFCFWVLGDYAVVLLWTEGFLSVSLSFTNFFLLYFHTSHCLF